MKNSLVSVTITTKNEEKNIENCLKSLKVQTYKEIEIIVVDNFSTDKTQEIAKKFTDKVYEKGPERSAQRNFGIIEKSIGEYAMFIDADMTLSKNLIESCINYIQSQNCDALYIKEIVQGNNYWNKVRRFERSFYDGTVIDGSRFFKRDLFIYVNGFDTSMSGPEDWDLDKKIKDKKSKILLLPEENKKNVIYHDESNFDLKKYIKKKAYYTQSFDSYINKWGKDDKDIKKQFSPLYRFLIVFLENKKWKKFLTRPDLIIGLYFLRILVGIQFLCRKKI